MSKRPVFLVSLALLSGAVLGVLLTIGRTAAPQGAVQPAPFTAKAMPAPPAALPAAPPAPAAEPSPPAATGAADESINSLGNLSGGA